MCITDFLKQNINVNKIFHCMARFGECWLGSVTTVDSSVLTTPDTCTTQDAKHTSPETSDGQSGPC